MQDTGSEYHDKEMTITENSDQSMDDVHGGGGIVTTRDPFQLELLDAVQKRRSRITGFEDNELKSVPKFDAAKSAKLSKFMAKGPSSVKPEKITERDHTPEHKPISTLPNTGKWTPSIKIDDSDDEEFLDEADFEDEYATTLMVTNAQNSLKRTTFDSNPGLKYKKKLEKENLPLRTLGEKGTGSVLTTLISPRGDTKGNEALDIKQKKSKMEDLEIQRQRRTGSFSSTLGENDSFNIKGFRGVDIRDKNGLDSRTELEEDHIIMKKGVSKEQPSKAEALDVQDHHESALTTHKRPVPSPRRRNMDSLSPRESTSKETYGMEKGLSTRNTAYQDAGLTSHKPFFNVSGVPRRSVVDFEVSSDSDRSDNTTLIRKQASVVPKADRQVLKSAAQKEKQGKYSENEDAKLPSPRDGRTHPRTSSIHKENTKDQRKGTVRNDKKHSTEPNLAKSPKDQSKRGRRLSRGSEDSADETISERETRPRPSPRRRSSLSKETADSKNQLIDDLFAAETNKSSPNVNTRTRSDNGKLSSRSHIEAEFGQSSSKSSRESERTMSQPLGAKASPRPRQVSSDDLGKSRKLSKPSTHEPLLRKDSSCLRPKSSKKTNQVVLDSAGRSGPMKAMKLSDSLLTKESGSKITHKTPSRPSLESTRTLSSTELATARDTLKEQKKSSPRLTLYHRSNSFSNISNIRPVLSKTQLEVGENFESSKSIRDQVYQEWLTRKTSVIKQKVRSEKEMHSKTEVGETEAKKSRKIEAEKAFEAWGSTKTERSKEMQKQVKKEKKKEKEKVEETVQKKLDAKKYFESWKSAKDEELKKKHRRSRSEEKAMALQTLREKAQKQEDAKKVFENWKSKKDEELKEKRSKDIQKMKEDKRKEKLEAEKKTKAEEAFEKWKDTKPGRRPSSTSLVQRPWCPSSRFTGNAIPEKVQPVVLAGNPNRARSASLSRQYTATRKMSMT